MFYYDVEEYVTCIFKMVVHNGWLWCLHFTLRKQAQHGGGIIPFMCEHHVETSYMMGIYRGNAAVLPSPCQIMSKL